jgi:hypothetical protein
MTFEAFFRATVASGYRLIFGSAGSGSDVVWLGKDRFTNNFVIFFGPSSYTETANNGYDVFDGNWHHMCFSANNGVGTLYLDNVSRSTTNFGDTSRTDAIRIATADTAQYFFAGRIASARIYNRALSASEVNQNFNANLRRFGI